MNPGRLDQRFTLQSLTRTDDEGGGYSEAWGDVATVWAEVEGLGGTEQLRAMAVGVTQPHRVIIRYRVGVTAAMRGVHHHPDGDRTHNITSVRETGGRRMYLELLTEVTA